MRSLGRSFAAALILTLLAGLIFGITPAAAAELETVVETLSIESVYVEEGAVSGDLTDINSAVAKAANNGIDLYVAVLATDTSGLKASAILDGLDARRAGDANEATDPKVMVLLFSPSVYDIVTDQICRSRFDQAKLNAETTLKTADAHVATLGLVDALVALPNEECDNSSSDNASSRAWWVWLLIFLAALATLWFVASIFKAMGKKRRREREEIEFGDRRRILQEWAGTLRAPITELQVPVAQAKSSSLASMFNDALKVARESDDDLNKATTLPELDRAEIRIARAQMQIRDVRKALDR